MTTPDFCPECGKPLTPLEKQVFKKLPVTNCSVCAYKKGVEIGWIKPQRQGAKK